MKGLGMIKNAWRKRWVFLSAMVCLTFGLMNGPLLAEEFVRYVDDDGLDSNTGESLALPWKTLEHAMTEIQSIGTGMTTDDSLVIYVGPGTYSVAANGEIDSASTYMINTPNVAIKGAGSGLTILSGFNNSGWTTGLNLYAANITITEIRFEDFYNSGVTINGCDNAKVLNCEFLNNGVGISVNGTSADITPELTGNIIDGSMSYGIQVTTGSTGIVSPFIKGNKISACSSSGINLMASSSTLAARIYANDIKECYYGIYMFADMGVVSPFISSNTLTQNSTGILVQGYYGSASPVIRSNLITSSQAVQNTYGILIYPPMSGSVTPEIAHNTIDGGGITETGITIPDGANVIPVIRYNIITNFSQYGINSQHTGTVDIDYNDVYGNKVQDYNGFDPAGTGNISANPLYETDFSIPSNSPCVDAISVAIEAILKVVVAEDLIGTTRPRASASGLPRLYDMGCYEYPHQDYLFTMPEGLGFGTDYRLMTLPLSSIDGGSFLTAFESAFGTYDPKLWRIFAYVSGSDPAEYMEIDNPAFAEYFSTFQGRAFWVISRRAALPKPSHVFGGSNTANTRPFIIDLEMGWNLVALPWADSAVNEDIELAHVEVKGQDSKHYLLDLENTLTSPAVWEYGASGYNELNNETDTMKIGEGYWVYSFSSGNTLMIPPNNSGIFTTTGKISRSVTSVKKNGHKSYSGLTPPQPPGSALTAEGGNGCFIGTLL